MRHFIVMLKKTFKRALGGKVTAYRPAGGLTTFCFVFQKITYLAVRKERRKKKSHFSVSVQEMLTTVLKKRI